MYWSWLKGSVGVLERNGFGTPVKLLIDGEVYQSEDDGLFYVALDKVRHVRLKDIPERVLLNVIQEETKNLIKMIPYSLLGPEVEYRSDGVAWVRIFVFKPWKYFDVRQGRRRVPVLQLLECYFRVLKRVSEIDSRVKKEEEDSWHYDLEEAEAYLSIALDPEKTVSECVDEVMQIFGKIDEEALSMLPPFPSAKSAKLRRRR